MNWTAGKSSFLGIAIGDRAITVAEIGPSRGSHGANWEVRRAAEFQQTAPAEAGGPEFGKFLNEHGFSRAAKVVVGVPARWLVARERELPPSSEEQAADVLRLQSERLFSAELGELVVDYAGTPDASSARGVLLLALPRKQLQRVVQLVEGAGRSASAVMPSTLALADAGAGTGTDGLVLSLSGDAVELAAHRDGAPRLLRHLPVRGNDFVSSNGARDVAVSSLAGEIRRTVAMMPQRGAGGETLQLWDGVGLGDDDARNIASQSGASARTADVGSLGLTTPTGHDTSRDAIARFAPALALAVAGAKMRPGAVDFLHPRLARPRKRRIGRRAAWAIALCGVAALVLLLLWIDARMTESQLATLRERLKADAPRIDNAAHTLDRISAARGWYGDGRPAVLDCLREITDAFPDGGEAIYVRKFSLPESRQGQLIGNSPNRALVLDLVDRMNANKNFADVRTDYTLDAGGTSNEVTFSISFTYQGVGGTKPVTPAR